MSYTNDITADETVVVNLNVGDSFTVREWKVDGEFSWDLFTRVDDLMTAAGVECFAVDKTKSINADKY